MEKLKKFVAVYENVGRFENANLKQRTIVYWAYSKEGAIQYFSRERVAFYLK
jgi:hypothetical protein